MKKLFMCMMSLILMLSFVCSIRADEKDPLLETLIEKGVLSQEEARKIEAETEKKEKNTGDNCGGFFSIKGEDFQIGGALVLSYLDAEKDSNKPQSQFLFNKLILSPKVALTDDAILKAKIKVTSSKTFGQEAYLGLTNLPLNSFANIGIMCRFITTDCISDEPPMIGRAFWDSEDVGILVGGDYESFYWRLSLSDGQELGTAAVGNDDSHHIIIDDRQTGDSNYNKEIGAGLGVHFEPAGSVNLGFLAFGYAGELSDDDVMFLQGIPGYGNSNDDTKRFYGGRVTLGIQNFQLVGECIDARDGELDRDGWYIQPSYKLKFPQRRWLQAFELLLRYGELNVDLINDPTDSLTWDRQMTTISFNTTIQKNIVLLAEYSMNDEDTGNGEVENNEFLLKLIVKF